MIVIAVLLVSLMLLAIASDIRSMTIPNRLNIALALLFVPSALFAGFTIGMAGAHVAAALAALAITASLFHLGWMGGGDAKLIAATALWFGPSAALVDYVVLASLFGGVLTLLVVSTRHLRQPTTGVVFLDRLLSPRSGVPYGVALGAAAITVALSGGLAPFASQS